LRSLVRVSKMYQDEQQTGDHDYQETLTPHKKVHIMLENQI